MDVRKTAWIVAALVPLALIGRVTPAESDAVREGAFLYATYCSNCHGEDGTGGGRTAKALKLEAPDLTRLARRNGGSFPTERVRRTIDGRAEVRGHGSSRMPIWGLTFQDPMSDSNQESQVKEKILRLVAYLETIQEAR